MKRKRGKVHPFFQQFKKADRSHKKRKIVVGTPKTWDLGIPAHIGSLTYQSQESDFPVEPEPEQPFKEKPKTDEITLISSQNSSSGKLLQSKFSLIKKHFLENGKFVTLFYGNGIGKSYHCNQLFSKFKIFHVDMLNFHKLSKFGDMTQNENVMGDKELILVEDFNNFSPSVQNYLGKFISRSKIAVMVIDTQKVVNKFIQFDFQYQFHKYRLFDNFVPRNDLGQILVKNKVIFRTFRKYFRNYSHFKWIIFPLICIYGNDTRKIICNLYWYLLRPITSINRSEMLGIEKLVQYLFGRREGISIYSLMEEVREGLKINVLFNNYVTKEIEFNGSFCNVLSELDPIRRFENEVKEFDIEEIPFVALKGFSNFVNMHQNYEIQKDDGGENKVYKLENEIGIEMGVTVDNKIIQVRDKGIQRRFGIYVKKIAETKNYFSISKSPEWIDFVCNISKGEKKRKVRLEQENARRRKKKRYFHHFQNRLIRGEMELVEHYRGMLNKHQQIK